MAVTLYRRTGLTGGLSSTLDGIDGNTIKDGDICFTFEGGRTFIHIADIDGGESESSPDVIVPDTNPGSINWKLHYTFGSNKIVEVADISDPSSELNALTGTYPGETILAYQSGTDTNKWTIYAWDDSSIESENVPYTVDGSSGLWVAVSGTYTNIDGDTISIDYVPDHYNRTTSPSEVSSVNHLTAHLKGIDDSLNNPTIIDYWT